MTESHIPIVPGAPAVQSSPPAVQSSASTHIPKPVKPKRPGWVIPALVAVVLVLVGGGYLLVSRNNITVTGSVTLNSTSLGLGPTGMGCAGSGGHADIKEGAQVVVSNGANEVIAFGHLRQGGLTSPYVCVLPFTIEVPAGEAIYQIRVTERRGSVNYTEDDLRSKPVELFVSS